jgi:hypothetical protein
VERAGRALPNDVALLFFNETNLRVRNCRICHLKSLHPLGLLIVLFLRRYPSLQFNHGGNRDEQQAL